MKVAGRHAGEVRGKECAVSAAGGVGGVSAGAEGMRTVLNDCGRVGCVLPTGIATDDTTKFFFQDVVGAKSLVSLFDFENRRGLFPDVDSRMKFCLFTSGSGAQPAADHAEYVFFTHAVEELRDPERRFHVVAGRYRAAGTPTRAPARPSAPAAMPNWPRQFTGACRCSFVKPGTARRRTIRGVSGSIECSTCPTTRISSGRESNSKVTGGSWRGTCSARTGWSTCRCTRRR